MDAEERGYERSPSLQAYAQAIIEAFPDVFDHLVDADIGYLFTNQEITMRGQRKAGFVTQPNAQGQDRYIYPWALKVAFGFVPELLVVIDHQVWEVMPDHARIALLYHENLRLEAHPFRGGRKNGRGLCPVFNT